MIGDLLAIMWVALAGWGAMLDHRPVQSAPPVPSDTTRDAGAVKVFLTDGATEAQVAAIRAWVTKDHRDCPVSYVSKQQALERVKTMFQDDPDILEDLPGNPFPAYMEIGCVLDEREMAELERLVGVAETTDQYSPVDVIVS